MKYTILIFLRILSICLSVDYDFKSKLSITELYSSKQPKFESDDSFSFTLRYADNNKKMYLCFEKLLEASLTYWLITSHLENVINIREVDIFSNCFSLLPFQCDDNVNICYIVSRRSRVLEIRLFDKKVTQPPKNLANYLSNQRQLFIDENSEPIFNALRKPNDFGDMKLYEVKKLYHCLLLSFEGKVDRAWLEGKKTVFEIHFRQNAEYYKDNLGNVLNLLTECDTNQNLKRRSDHFIKVLASPKGKFTKEHIIYGVWNMYYQTFIKDIPLNENYFKPIFAWYMEKVGNKGSMDILYSNRKCYKPSDTKYLQNYKEKVVKFLSFPLCAGNAFKKYMEKSLLPEMIMLKNELSSYQGLNS
jgi:hypothetical protein